MKRAACPMKDLTWSGRLHDAGRQTRMFVVLPLVTAAVLGGIGNIPGAVLGALLMGVAETTVVWLGYSNFRDAIAFIILIIVLLFRPGGLLGSAKVEKV